MSSLQEYKDLARVVWTLAVFAFGALALAWTDAAIASVNIPLHHWTYEAIERLTDLGVIDKAMLATKPYSRKEAARYVARALERVRHDQVSADGTEVIAQPLLERLMREFRAELIGLNAVTRNKEDKVRAVRYGGAITTEVDGFSVGGGQTVRLRENRGGEYYANGAINQTDVRGWMELGDWVTATFQPKFISDNRILGFGATENSKNIYIREGSLKVSHYNVSFEVGRGTQWWGQGYRGTLLLSDHAYPLDMIKLYSEEPFKIPWLEGLGDWKVHSFLTRLEANRDFERAKVFGLRISYLPTDWLELGVARLTQYGGKGHEDGFMSPVFATYFRNPGGQNTTGGGKNDVNDQAMIDAKFRIPKVPWIVPFPAGMQLYMEIGFEDRIDHPAGLVGFYIPQVFKADSLDFRFEFVDTDWEQQVNGQSGTWYNNGIFTSGMRYRGYPLGHWIGTDGIGFTGRSTRKFGDQFILGLHSEYTERQRTLPVHEKKREAGIDVTYLFSDKIQFTVNYTYQNIKNPGQITAITPFTETFTNTTVNNNFVWTTLAIEF